MFHGAKTDISGHISVEKSRKTTISDKANQIWSNIYQNMICPCIQHIEAYEFEKAYDLYKTFTLRLKEKYLCT